MSSKLKLQPPGGRVPRTHFQVRPPDHGPPCTLDKRLIPTAYAHDSPRDGMRVIRRKMAAKVQAMLNIIVVASASLVYINSLNGQLVFDDHRAIISNEDLDSNKTTLQDLFQHDFWGGHMNRVESHKSYRPLTVLTYRLFNFQIHQLEPYGYHVVNVCSHVVASLLFLTFCQICIHGSKLWALYGALLFSVHSIHTEAVSFVYSHVCVHVLFIILVLYWNISII